MPNTLPKIGAALSVLDLPRHRDWLLSDARDLELRDFCFGALLNGNWHVPAQMAREALDGFEGRLGIHGPFMGFHIDSSDPDMQPVIAKRMDQALDICAALGAVQMVVHSPYTIWDNSHLDLTPNARSRKIEKVHACMGAAVARAANQGVTIVIENIEDMDPTDRLCLAESFGTDAVKLSVDTGHAHYMHVTHGAPAADCFIRAAGARLAHVHLQDVDGYADRHWALGEGTVPWPAIFRALAETKADPHLVLELNDPAGIRSSADWLAARGLAR